jgi:gas vesicle protein
MKKLWRKNRKRQSLTKILIGLAVGSLIGATVGMLMSPYSGQEIRRRLAGQVRGVQEKAKTAVGNVGNQARELADQARGHANEMQGSVSRRRTTSEPV